MVRDVWAVGAAYEPYVGRWSRRVAAEFVRWLAVPPGARWLDVGCGTGAVTAAVLAGAAPARVVGVDPSAGFVGYAAAAVDRGSPVGFTVGDARALPLRERAVDAVVGGLMLNFVPDPARAIAEMARVTGGVAAAYVWDYAEGMGFMRAFWDAAAAVDPAAPDEGSRFPLCRPEPLRSAFAGAGLTGVEVEAIEIPTRFRDFADFWEPFLGGQGAAPAYLATLPADRQAALREHLREALPYGPQGGIDLTARAWAVRGHRG